MMYFERHGCDAEAHNSAGAAPTQAETNGRSNEAA